jgi:hypothetical protein
MAFSKIEQFGLFMNALVGWILIFGLPLAVNLIIQVSYPSKQLTDVGDLLTYIAYAVLVGFMINLGLFSAAEYDKARYVLYMAISLLLAAGLYAISYILLSDEKPAEGPTQAPK